MWGKWGKWGEQIEFRKADRTVGVTVNLNPTVSLSKFSFFKLLHMLIRSYQVPVLLICPLALSHFLKFMVNRCPRTPRQEKIA